MRVIVLLLVIFLHCHNISCHGYTYDDHAAADEDELMNLNRSSSSLQRQRQRRPLTPPAPLFQSASHDFITLSMQRDPNDGVHTHVYENVDNNDNDDNVLYFSLQMEQRPRRPRPLRSASVDLDDLDNDDDDGGGGGGGEGVWIDVRVQDGQHDDDDDDEIMKIQPLDHHFFTTSSSTATVFHLSPDMDYRFRTRVTNHYNNLSSPWSSPSVVMRVPVGINGGNNDDDDDDDNDDVSTSTMMDTYYKPMNVSVTSKTSHSVHLSWDMMVNDDDDDDDDDDSYQYSCCHWYQIQYRRQIIQVQVQGGTSARIMSSSSSSSSSLEYEHEHDHDHDHEMDHDHLKTGDENPLAWVDHPILISGIAKFSIPEIQEVTTTWINHSKDDDEEEDNDDIDVPYTPSQMISRGYFRLKLEVVPTEDHTIRRHTRTRTNKLQSTMISGPIPYNATKDEFEHAMMQIDGVTNVRVFRYRGYTYRYNNPIQHPTSQRREMNIHPSPRGEYSWRVEFETEGSARSSSSIPLLQVVKDTLGSVGDGRLYGSPNVNVSVRRLVKGSPTSYERKSLSAIVSNLDPETFYEFRIRGGKDDGHDDGVQQQQHDQHHHHYYGPWSEILSGIQTNVELLSSHDDMVDKDNLIMDWTTHTRKVSGIGRFPGNSKDLDYVSGAGMGGLPLEDGGNGMIVIISYDRKDMTMAHRSYFYYSKEVQYYMTDDDSENAEFIDVKVWAGGSSGGGTSKSVPESDASDGVGGDYVQARINIQAGEMLMIQVGEGGHGSPLDKDKVDQHNSNYKERFGSTTFDYDTGIQRGGNSAMLRKNGKLIVSAGGGNGGSSFINFSDVYIQKGKDDLTRRRPRPPIISNIKHDSLQVSWELNTYDTNIGNNFEAFNIELSSGREGAGLENGQCSDDFEVVNIVQVNGEYRFTRDIEGLVPNTPYCVRLAATGHHGASRKSFTSRAVTLEKPKNKWWYVHSRDALNPPIKSTTICPTPEEPSPRRGHSVSFLNEKVYLFGGYTNACMCSEDDEDKCSYQMIHSNELWELDTFSNIWRLLLPNSIGSDTPFGREEHSATVLSNGKLAIVGGRSEKNKQPLFLGDVWEFDPGQVTSHTFSSNNEQALIDGHTSYHEILVEIPFRDNYRPGELCVKDMSVDIKIQHPCVEQVDYISLHGPDLQKSSFQNQGDDVKLFLGPSGFTECSGGNATITFSDSATRSVLDYGSTLPNSGSYVPAENIGSHFEGERVDGIWTLAINDKLKDDTIGILMNWTLHFEVEHCSVGGTWMELSSSSNSCNKAFINGDLDLQECQDNSGHHLENASQSGIFTPRHSQTAISVGDDIFILGMSIDGIKETWRFTYSSKIWTKLHGLYREKRWVGQAGVLMPYGVVTFSGLRIEQDKSHFDHRLYHYNILTERRTLMSSISMDGDQGHHPLARSFGGMCFIDKSHLIFDATKLQDLRDVRNSIEPAIMMYAGDKGLTDDNFLSDQWFLTLNDLHFTTGIEVERQRDEACHYLLNPSRTGNNRWDWTCGALADENSDNACRFEDIILMAWCLKQYNSFTSPF